MEDLNIRHFKLVNGEDIIAIVSSKNKDNWLVERPVVITNNIVGGYQFSPWFPFSNTKAHKILMDKIVNSTGIDPDVKESYLNFVLSLKKKPTPGLIADSDLLLEMEQELDASINRLAEEGLLPSNKKKVIH
jgi:hypothetical protein|tara:strand:- start:1729 stop:2124 length:396 start_codon:yes stop_codon:yes gene_type:complete